MIIFANDIKIWEIDKENKLILYKDNEGKVSVNTRFADENVWLTQAQQVEIYQSSKSNISEHLTNIFNDKEFDQDAVVRKFRTTAADGKNYQVLHYNLDVIIALGYRVQSPIAVRFRRWATQRLHEYIQKGFTMDDERLKQGGIDTSKNCCNVWQYSRKTWEMMNLF